ncbi:ABC transporter substrate-binding protein [Cohnella fermenti]|nr:extracellular solute-binding protein [Cohnella fermenti]
MRKKLGVVIASMLLLGTAAGCGSNDKAGSGAESSASSASQQASPNASDTGGEQSAPADGADSEAFTITVSSWNLADEPLGIVKAYREAFENVYKQKYLNATIKYNNTPGDKYFDLLKAQLASASAADVIQFQPSHLPMFTTAGFLADLSDLSLVSSLEGAMKTEVTYQDKVYAIPFDISTNGVWYNRKLFEDNGVTPPATWDELLAVADKFKGMGITPFAGGFKDAWVSSMTVKTFTMNDYSSPTFEEEVYNGSKKLNGPEMQATFDKLQLFYDRGYFGPDAMSNGWDLQRKAFEDGKAAMIIHGSYIAGLVNSEMQDKGGMETGFFPLPNDDGAPVLSVGSDTLTGVNAKTPNLQRAKDLVAAMHDAEAQTIRDKDAGVFPALKGIDIEYKELGNHDFQRALAETDSLLGGQYVPASVYDVYGKLFTKIMAGKTFDPAWLDEADQAYAQDKSLLPPPGQ